jgi:hypothetical protein
VLDNFWLFVRANDWSIHLDSRLGLPRLSIPVNERDGEQLSSDERLHYNFTPPTSVIGICLSPNFTIPQLRPRELAGSQIG